jgi:hypothetical protein
VRRRRNLAFIISHWFWFRARRASGWTDGVGRSASCCRRGRWLCLFPHSHTMQIRELICCIFSPFAYYADPWTDLLYSNFLFLFVASDLLYLLLIYNSLLCLYRCKASHGICDLGSEYGCPYTESMLTFFSLGFRVHSFSSLCLHWNSWISRWDCCLLVWFSHPDALRFSFMIFLGLPQSHPQLKKSASLLDLISCLEQSFFV